MASEDIIEARYLALREAFESKLKDKLAGYDERDVERFRKDDAYVKCFLRSYANQQGELDKPLEHVDMTFAWRKEQGVNDLKEDSFPPELKKREFLYWQGANKDNQKILHFMVVKHEKGTMVDEVKKFITYHLDQYQKEAPGVRIALIFDFTGAGVMNMDLDIVKFIISTFSNYFPSLLNYILLFEMPFILSAAWKLIQTWLSEKQRKKIILVTKSDITQYITPEEMLPHMK